MSRLELPVVASPYYRLPRERGGGLAVAPELPFTDLDTVLAAVNAAGTVDTGPGPQRLTVSCPPGAVAPLAARLTETGTGDLRVVIRLDTVPGPDITPSTVERLVHAGVAALEIRDDVQPAEHELADWFELGKACLCYGLPLLWTGSLPLDAVPHWAHLPPPANQPEWRRRWRYGSLGWRRGPGFAAVIDSRGADIRQRRVRLAALTPMFGERLDRPVPVSGTEQDALVAAGLAAVFAGRAVWLPYRLRRWPPNTLLL